MNILFTSVKSFSQKEAEIFFTFYFVNVENLIRSNLFCLKVKLANHFVTKMKKSITNYTLLFFPAWKAILNSNMLSTFRLVYGTVEKALTRHCWT